MKESILFVQALANSQIMKILIRKGGCIFITSISLSTFNVLQKSGGGGGNFMVLQFFMCKGQVHLWTPVKSEIVYTYK